MRLRKKIIIVFLLISLIPINIISISNYIFTEEDIISLVTKEIELYANIQEKRLNSSIQQNYERINAINTISSLRTNIVDFFDTGDPDTYTELQKILSDALLTSKEYRTITVLDNTGNPIISVGDDLYYNKKYSKATDNIVDFIFNHDSEIGFLRITSPIIIDGHHFGTMMLDVSPKIIHSITQETPIIGDTVETIIVEPTDDGNAMVVSPLRLYSEKLPIIISNDRDGPITQAILSDKDVLYDGIDYRGEPVISAIRHSQSGEFGLIVKIDKAEALMPIDNLRFEIFAINLILGIIITIISVGFAQTLSMPLRKLTDACKIISGGNLLHKINIKKGNEELDDLAKSFENMQKYLIKQNQQRNEFSAMITHELKTPLVPIDGYCRMLTKQQLGKLNQEQLDAVAEIKQNSDQLLGLIQNILNTQKLEAGGMSYNLNNISVDRFKKSIRTTLIPFMHEKDIQFETNFDDNLIVIGDESKLKELFTNLVQNSVDFVPNKNGKIEIGAKNKGKMVEFYVKDNGNGIPKDQQQHLFKKFYQIDTSLTRKHGGSGLGLVICKGYVEGMGGKMKFESEVGKGTTFYFTLLKVQEKELENMEISSRE